jgi:hypothetical protein
MEARSAVLLTHTLSRNNGMHTAPSPSSLACDRNSIRFLTALAELIWPVPRHWSAAMATRDPRSIDRCIADRQQTTSRESNLAVLGRLRLNDPIRLTHTLLPSRLDPTLRLHRPARQRVRVIRIRNRCRRPLRRVKKKKRRTSMEVGCLSTFHPTASRGMAARTRKVPRIPTRRRPPLGHPLAPAPPWVAWISRLHKLLALGRRG